MIRFHDHVHRRLMHKKKAMIQATRCSLFLSGAKMNFRPWILVLVMKLVVISFHVAFLRSDLVLFRGVSRALADLRGHGEKFSAEGASAMIACATSQHFLPINLKAPLCTYLRSSPEQRQESVSLQPFGGSGWKLIFRKRREKKQQRR